jgi:hypothetical protein
MSFQNSELSQIQKFDPFIQIQHTLPLKSKEKDTKISMQNPDKIILKPDNAIKKPDAVLSKEDWAKMQGNIDYTCNKMNADKIQEQVAKAI